MAKSKTPIALEAYELLAERYSERAEDKAENGYIEHPAMRALIGQVSELKVLEAGCGPGFLASHLIAGGATVTAFDVSPAMLELCRKRTRGKALLFLADMANKLEFIHDAEFDIVVSSLAIDYIEDWTTPMREFYRALVPGGRFIFSVQHPLSAYLCYQPPAAIGVHQVKATWTGFGGDPVTVPDYYRSFEEIVNPILAAGFILKTIKETRPVDALKERDPIRYERFSKIPLFMCIEAQK